MSITPKTTCSNPPVHKGVGTYRNRIKNRMAGVQIGADIFYPVSLRGNFGFRGKAGVYANFDETNVYCRMRLPRSSMRVTTASTWLG